MKEIYVIITFDTTHLSIAADKLLDERSIVHKLIPVPQSISAGCGFCLRVDAKDTECAKSALTEKEISISGLYRVERDGLKSSIMQISQNEDN